MKEEKMKGQGNFANMPTEVKMTQYPKYPNAGERELNDTITGIDETVTRSSGKRSKYVSNQK